MKINIEVNNETQEAVGDSFFLRVAEKTLQEVNWDFLQESTLSISVAIVSLEKIHELNKQYRQVDNATDVLSFAEYEKIDAAVVANAMKTDGEIFLGELILCYDDIKEYAEKEHIEFEDELTNVFSHGTLHLLGFGHGEEMFAIQNKVVKQK
jgi:probable rRNA maturation factor